jgi:hypothetical protein
VRADADSDFPVKPFEKLEQFVRGKAEPSSPSRYLCFFLLLLCQISGVLAEREFRKAKAITCPPGA